MLHNALEADARDRHELLARECGSDVGLRREVESLIASYEQDERFLEGGSAALERRDEDEWFAGRRIGPYELTREIGRGGMGTVFLASRADAEFRKWVAVKLVRRGMDTKQILSRFRQERQILASLEHPNVARLLDGGTTDEGLPYFVMEYIEGEPIDRYCSARRLATVDRLRLFRAVCGAVQYAHQNLLVHRDLKPGNILVTPDGVPKLLDFGIAKLLKPELYDYTIAQTVAPMRPMTPDYASPEQVRGQAITTASDIYSLGVLLYELLTDRHPYELNGKGMGELERAICEQEPEKPSAVVRASRQRRGFTRRTPRPSYPPSAELYKLPKRLTGDLDNIVLMAMRKEPHRRYPSVEQLSDDIRRHLEGLPVGARKDTFGYTTGKFIRRHRAGTIAAIMIVATLIAGVLGTASQARRARQQRDRAERVSAFLADLFRLAAPGANKGEAITVREMLDRGSERIVSEMSDQPEVQATLMETMASAYGDLGLWPRAETLQRSALEIRRQVFGENHPDVARSVDLMAEVLQGEGDYPGAETLFREALTMRRRLVDRGSEEMAGSLNNLAYVLKVQGKFNEAEPLYRESLAISRALGSKSSVGYRLNNLAMLLVDYGDPESGEPMLREALAIFKELEQSEPAGLAACMRNLGHMLCERGRIAEAESLTRQSLEMRKRQYGEEHLLVSVGLADLGWTLRARNDYVGAESLLRQALAMHRKLHGDDHPRNVGFMCSLATVLHESGKNSEAERLFKETLELNRKVGRGEHPDAGAILTGLGAVLTERGGASRAEELLREGLAILQRSLLPTHWRIAAAQSALGVCLATQRRFDEAAPLMAEAHSRLTSCCDENGKETRIALERLTNLYQSLNAPNRAVTRRAPVPHLTSSKRPF